MVMAQAQVLKTEISALDGCVVMDEDDIADAAAVDEDAPAVHSATEVATAAKKEADIASLQKSLKWMVLARDGASAPIVATRKVVERNTEKGIHCLFGKTPAGTSMSTAPNDLGMMHSETHAAFRNAKYDYGDSLDPVGPAYKQAKAYLQQYVVGSSFKTLWKFIATSETMLSSTFRPANVVDSVVVAGIYPRSDEVVLRHCPAFYQKASETTVRYLLDSVKEGAVEVEKNGFVSEQYYDQLLALYKEEVDFCTPLQGSTQLNDLATNRGRGMIDSNPEYMIEQLLRNRIKEDAAAEAELRKTERARIAKERADKVEQDLLAGIAVPVGNMRSCCNITCLNKNPIKKGSKEWSKCPELRCRNWCCELEVCKALLQQHTEICGSF